MEVARSLEPRRVKKEYGSDRMAEEILSLAFERLTDRNELRTSEKTSEQNDVGCVDRQLILLKEGM